MARFDLTDAEWAVLEPLLPAQPRRGGQWRDHRQVINGICWVKRTGSPWRDMPERYGPWKTCHERFRRWAADGTWTRLKQQVVALAEADGDIDWDAQVDSTVVRAHQHAAGARKGGSTKDSQARQGLGRSRGGLTTKVHTMADGRGRSLATRITPGQASDTKQLVPLLDQIAVTRPGGVGRPRKRPDSLTADKAYSSKANRAALRARKIAAVIPERADQKANRTRKGSSGGRPPDFDTSAYTHRNQVERGFGRRKHWRGLATRYDKLIESYEATLDLIEMLDWLRAVPDHTP
ncbi:IS5 family transposase [Plantactinospora sp. WMMB334]|uniref:IS5 family transposase n=1 Tax=Plantactinospora sp. WMMB334 TaxID=3404119 RepID=UPI003B938A08